MPRSACGAARARGRGGVGGEVPSSVLWCCGAGAGAGVAAGRAASCRGCEGVLASTDGVFDTIVCVRVLCSVPELERTAQELYALLRPGGQLLVVEHVVNPWRTAKGSIVARVMQAVYGFFGWSWFVGNCCLDRDTEMALRAAADRDGGWEVVELDRWFGRSPIPYISGVLVKKST